VLTQDGSELGRVTELRTTGHSSSKPHQNLRVTHLQYGPHVAGSELGYTADPAQGPLPLGALIRWWQRRERLAPLSDILKVDQRAGTVTIAHETTHIHPHKA
jgi:hypothetical protein